jgi:hypothetical protein
MCLAINRAQAEILGLAKVEPAIDPSGGLHARRGSQPPTAYQATPISQNSVQSL